jgi:hypothetical protein
LTFKEKQNVTHLLAVHRGLYFPSTTAVDELSFSGYKTKSRGTKRYPAVSMALGVSDEKSLVFLHRTAG